MDNTKLPSVMAVSIITWKDDGPAHTEPNLFHYLKKENVAQVYTRSDLPETESCERFFQIPETGIVKSVLTRKPVGRILDESVIKNGTATKDQEREKALYSKNKNKSWFLTIAREIVWALGCWKTKELVAFVKDFNPDVYFFPVYPAAFMGWIQLWILGKNPKPYVCYLADDNYTYLPCGRNPLALFHRWLLRKPVIQLINGCSELFVITDFEGREIKRDFGKDSVTLTKGIDFSGASYQESDIHTPIRMVYTGKLALGRASSLAAISKAMAVINASESRIVMEVYSTDKADDKTMALLNMNGCKHCGVAKRSEVEEIQKNADIVIFAESLERKDRYSARLSFSTKLTDYFKSGKCIFAIGDEHIAPIEYLRENDAAVIANDYGQILEILNRFVTNKKIISEYSRKAFDCGVRNHSEDVIRKRFVTTMKKVAKKGIGE